MEYSNNIYQYEWSTNKLLSEELTDLFDIAVDDYVLKDYPQNRSTALNVRYVKFLKYDTPILIFNVKINKSILLSEFNKEKLEKYLLNYIKRFYNEIFESNERYYLLDPSVIIKNLNVTDDKIIFQLRIPISQFETIDEVRYYIQNNNEKIREAGVKRPQLINPDATTKCDVIYNEYKDSCKDTWDIRKDKNVKNEEILSILYKLDNCLEKRRVSLDECPSFRTDGHIGAIRKLQNMKKYYGDLLSTRVNSAVNFNVWKL